MSMTMTHQGSLRATVLALVLCAHALALWALLHSEAGRRLVAEVKPLFVNVIEDQPPPRPEPPQPRQEPPHPRPQPQKPAAPEPPILATEVPAPAPVFETPAPKEPPVIAPPSAPVAVAPPAPPKPEPLIPPSFGAAYLENPAPAYPLASRRFGEQGRVVLRVFVTAQGAPGKVELNTSSGFDRLDNTALETVRRWRFVPAKRGDEAVAAWVLVPIVFRIGD